MRTYWIAQETLLSALWWPKWEGNPKCGAMLVVQLCLTLRDPVDCSLLGSSVHGIFQARILEWVSISFSKMERKSKMRGYMCKYI